MPLLRCTPCSILAPTLSLPSLCASLFQPRSTQQVPSLHPGSSVRTFRMASSISRLPGILACCSCKARSVAWSQGSAACHRDLNQRIWPSSNNRLQLHYWPDHCPSGSSKTPLHLGNPTRFYRVSRMRCMARNSHSRPNTVSSALCSTQIWTWSATGWPKGHDSPATV